MKAAVKRFLKDERGLETVEYAVILGLIVAATIGLVVTLGKWTGGQFQGVVNTTAGTGAAPLP
ncbi:MAG: Flp family type IVb pilin [Phycisphaerales bacterium]|jgi:Flp pilus assembly pilin Flp|nr:MAG: Flp family type IVb pilin [Phycisphaerales bacterium]